MRFSKLLNSRLVVVCQRVGCGAPSQSVSLWGFLVFSPSRVQNSTTKSVSCVSRRPKRGFCANNSQEVIEISCAWLECHVCMFWNGTVICIKMEKLPPLLERNLAFTLVCAALMHRAWVWVQRATISSLTRVLGFPRRTWRRNDVYFDIQFDHWDKCLVICWRYSRQGSWKSFHHFLTPPE